MRLVAPVPITSSPTFSTVIPAKAGIHSTVATGNAKWIPAFGGMAVLMFLVLHPTEPINL